MAPHNILYVDDEVHNLDAFCRAFYDCDWIDEIYTTTSAEEGLALLDRHDIHAIVSDQRMPGMVGTEFLARAVEKHPDPVRLILTAYTDVKDILDAINRGHVYFFVSKPWEAEGLKMILRRALEHYETKQELARKNRQLEHALASLEGAHREQVRLYEMVITDEKTGVRNYHYLRIRLGEEFERARRYPKDLSLIMVDIDDFKAVNDAHGHLVGDEVIRAVARHLRSALRLQDLPGRYGGEEFGVVLPDTALEGAEVIAERVRRRIGDAVLEKTGVRATVSIGIAALDPAEPSYADWISQADRALYAAKANGRNRCEAFRRPATSSSRVHVGI